MANRDTVSEVYKDSRSPAHERTRRRIDWMCEQAAGLVLDLGCSQGIAAILMARAGHTAVGVDVEIDRLEYAMKDRREEAVEVAERVSFVGGSGLSLPFRDATFDTVVLGEVLEHLSDPTPFVAEAARVARPDGRVVITVPFGYHPHHDHRHTFYVASLLDVVKHSLTPESIDIVDKYLHVVARPVALDDRLFDEWVLRLQPLMERELRAVEEDALRRHQVVRHSLDRHKERVDLLVSQRDHWHRRAVAAERRIREFEAKSWQRVRRSALRLYRASRRRVTRTVAGSRRLGSRSRKRAGRLFFTYLDRHREYWPEHRYIQSDKLERRLERWAALWSIDTDEAARRLFDMACRRAPQRPAPVYVTGLGGSGSHWVAGMLSELPGHVGAGEVYFAPKLLEEMRALSGAEQGVVADAVHLLHSPPGPDAITSSVVNCAAGPYKIPNYRRWDRHATVVLLLRDPRDQVLSTAFRKPIHREKVAPGVGDLEYLLQQCAT
ncbi:MAG TPA: class I SAM-dependent methyltransferase, partial [Acidimicrobiia bacterium]|nr:class I SAM-dependent methyltransferase [Acidimicrobiia bacterium]